MASESVASIIAQAYQAGSKFVLVRDTGSFYLTRTDTISDELLVLIETHKLAVYIAIGGVPSDIDETDTGDDTGIDASEVNVQGLIDLLRERGVEVLPSDEVTQESLNRHYFHFTNKLEAVADILESSISG